MDEIQEYWGPVSQDEEYQARQVAIWLQRELVPDNLFSAGEAPPRSEK